MKTVFHELCCALVCVLLLISVLVHIQHQRAVIQQAKTAAYLAPGATPEPPTDWAHILDLVAMGISALPVVIGRWRALMGGADLPLAAVPPAAGRPATVSRLAAILAKLQGRRDATMQDGALARDLLDRLQIVELSQAPFPPSLYRSESVS